MASSAQKFACAWSFPNPGRHNHPFEASGPEQFGSAKGRPGSRQCCQCCHRHSCAASVTLWEMQLILLALLIVAVVVSANYINASGRIGPDTVEQHYGWRNWRVWSHECIGYITVNGSFHNGAHLFYWMFESRNDPQKDPLVWVCFFCNNLLGAMDDWRAWLLGNACFVYREWTLHYQ